MFPPRMRNLLRSHQSASPARHSWLRRPYCEPLEPRMLLANLAYSTFLGGSVNDEVYAVAADAAGNSYLVGSTASENFGATVGSFDQSLNGTYDAFVAKVRANGSLAWATYLGGSGSERAHGVAVDASGDVYILGRTDSADFPTTPGSFDPTLNGNVDGFVTKLKGDGSGLVYSTYLGGSGFEIDEGFDALARRVGAIAIDAGGNAYVTGSTNSTNFPTTAGALRSTNAGFNDVFVAKLNAAGSSLLFATYLGGSDYDRGYGIAVDAGGNVFVAGESVSINFPTTNGAFQRSKGGGFNDAFVAKLNASGSSLQYSTYLGGIGAEMPGRLAIDGLGNAYVTGTTDSFDFPTTAGALQTARTPSGFDAYVAKLNASGSALVFSTYLGGAFGNDYGEGIAVDSNANVYITGQATSATFPVINAFQPAIKGVNDAYVAKLASSGSALIYSSYLGGGYKDYSYAIAVDAAGTAHLAGYSGSNGVIAPPAFPTTANALQPASSGGFDGFVSRITSQDSPPPTAIRISDVSGAEGNLLSKRLVFTVSLSSPSNQTTTVNYATRDGTATLANQDYRQQAGTLSFAPGEMTKSIVIVINGDRRLESDETFFVDLSNPTNATLSDPLGTGTILNDEGSRLLSPSAETLSRDAIFAMLLNDDQWLKTQKRRR